MKRYYRFLHDFKNRDLKTGKRPAGRLNTGGEYILQTALTKAQGKKGGCRVFGKMLASDFTWFGAKGSLQKRP